MKRLSQPPLSYVFPTRLGSGCIALLMIVGKSSITRGASIPRDCSSLWTTSDQDCLAGFEFGTIRLILKMLVLAFAVLVKTAEVSDRSRKPIASVEIRSLPSFRVIFLASSGSSGLQVKNMHATDETRWLPRSYMQTAASSTKLAVAP